MSGLPGRPGANSLVSGAVGFVPVDLSGMYRAPSASQLVASANTNYFGLVATQSSPVTSTPYTMVNLSGPGVVSRALFSATDSTSGVYDISVVIDGRTVLSETSIAADAILKAGVIIGNRIVAITSYANFDVAPVPIPFYTEFRIVMTETSGTVDAFNVFMDYYLTKRVAV